MSKQDYKLDIELRISIRWRTKITYFDGELKGIKIDGN